MVWGTDLAVVRFWTETGSSQTSDLFGLQEDEAGEGAGGSALEDLLGRGPHEQPGQSLAERQQDHSVTGECACTGAHTFVHLLVRKQNTITTGSLTQLIQTRTKLILCSLRERQHFLNIH